ncbi:MAG: Creatinine amidohydrolase [candidate division BRC1 bacterium ADurb.BinA364]|nr:MAG: Creatinine amidohydrolase [candidate division BRC1 bacterium ADurb.BinA364]
MKWLELTSVDLERAREETQGVAMIPAGSLERHGPHLPLGTDTLSVQAVADRVEQLEAVVVLPVLPYTHVPPCVFHPGAIHIKQKILLDFVTNICDEVYRNGFEKIAILHGHGGNVPLQQAILPHMLEERKPYALYSIGLGGDPELRKRIMESPFDGHAGEGETSSILHLRPDLVKMERIQGVRFDPAEELDVAPATTAVDWICRWNEMAVGEPDKATAEKGRLMLESRAQQVAETLRKIKRDTALLERMRQRRAMRF